MYTSMMKCSRINNHGGPQTGFSLIEMIVSLAIFAVVITMAVGSLLVLIANNQKLQEEQSVMTNLAFAMDAMTREIRTGYSYVCLSASSENSPVFIGGENMGQIFRYPYPPNNNTDGRHDSLGEEVYNDCGGTSPDGLLGISFYEGGDSITTNLGEERILYYYDSEDRMIYRRVGDRAPESMLSSGLAVEDFSIIVSGSQSLESGGDVEQPTVTIYLKATEVADPEKQYELQTTVTQRILDL